VLEVVEAIVDGDESHAPKWTVQQAADEAERGTQTLAGTLARGRRMLSNNRRRLTPAHPRG
jgi:hypothetical protein